MNHCYMQNYGWSNMINVKSVDNENKNNKVENTKVHLHQIAL